MAAVQRRTLVTCENCYLHRICLSTIRLLHFADLHIKVVINDKEVVFLEVADFRLQLDQKFHSARFQNEKVITYYILDGNTGLYAITISKEDPQILNLEKTLEIAGIVITDTSIIDTQPEVKNWLQQHWPTYATQQIISVNFFSKNMTKGSNYFQKRLESVEDKVVGGIRNKANNIIENMGKERTIVVEGGEQATDNWMGKVKKGAGFLYEKASWAISGILDPVVGSVHKANTKLCDKIDRSDSRFFKKTKEVLSVTEVSIRNTFDGLKGVIKGVSGELYSEGKEVILQKMKNSPPAIATEGTLESIQSSDAPSNNIDSTQMAIVQKKEEVFAAPKSPKETLLVFPKLPDITTPTEMNLVTQEVKLEDFNDTLKLDELSLDESVIEQAL